MGLDDKVWPDLDLGQTEEGVCAVERFYPKVGVSRILKRYLEYFNRYLHFSKLKYVCK